MEDNVFEQLAKKYDTENRRELAEVIVKKVRPMLQDKKSKSVIDYGSGTGLVGLAIADLVDSILLVDASEQMLSLAEGKIAQQKLGKVKTLQADLTKETPTLKADIVLMSLVLLHIPNTELILERIFSILNEDGQLIIVDFDKNDKVTHPKVHNGFSQQELEEKLCNAGFKPIERRTFYHGEKVFVNEDASLFIANSRK